MTLLIVSLLACQKEKQVHPADITTVPVTDVLYTSAFSGGIINDDGGASILSKGICWNTASGPTTDNKITVEGNGSGSFESIMIGLSFGTTYYVRAYATNSQGTVYGNELSFITHVAGVHFNQSLTYGSLADGEGNNYKTIQIGGQVWMAENLKSTKFNDGTAIPLEKIDLQWTNLTTPAYCWFNNNDTVYAGIYGAYYNWFSVNTGKLCPTGWHIPSDIEWQTLVDFLGGEHVAGSKLKEAGTNNWLSTNKGATNQSGFTALPAGLRGSIDGTFAGAGDYGGWWSTTEVSSGPFGAAWIRWIHGDTSVVVRNEIYKKDGFAVRCIKD